MKTIRVLMLGLLLCLSCESVQAKSHLSRDEIKILSVTSVAVVYVDSDTPIQPYIQNNGDAGGSGILANVVLGMNADAVLQHQLSEFGQRIAPYQSVIAGLNLLQSTRKAVQDALASIPALQQTAWTDAIPEPKDRTFMKEQALKTKAQVVIFIRPWLMMDVYAGVLYMVTPIDIETLDATGKSYDHYEGSELSSYVAVDDDCRPWLHRRHRA